MNEPGLVTISMNELRRVKIIESVVEGRLSGVRAAASVNRELVALYWQIGRDILDRQQKQGWGAGVVDRLARDLKAAFPEMRGFSPRNLKCMRALAQAFSQPELCNSPLQNYLGHTW